MLKHLFHLHYLSFSFFFFFFIFPPGTLSPPDLSVGVVFQSVVEGKRLQAKQDLVRSEIIPMLHACFMDRPPPSVGSMTAIALALQLQQLGQLLEKDAAAAGEWKTHPACLYAEQVLSNASSKVKNFFFSLKKIFLTLFFFSLSSRMVDDLLLLLFFFIFYLLKMISFDLCFICLP